MRHEEVRGWGRGRSGPVDSASLMTEAMLRRAVGGLGKAGGGRGRLAAPASDCARSGSAPRADPELSRPRMGLHSARALPHRAFHSLGTIDRLWRTSRRA